MAAMPSDGPGKIVIPRWIQLVGLPLAVVGAWLFVSAVDRRRIRVRRRRADRDPPEPDRARVLRAAHPARASVLLVYVFFAVAIGGLSVIAGTVVAREAQVGRKPGQRPVPRATRTASRPADRKLSDLQRWINDSSPVKVERQGAGRAAAAPRRRHPSAAVLGPGGVGRRSRS